MHVHGEFTIDIHMIIIVPYIDSIDDIDSIAILIETVPADYRYLFAMGKVLVSYRYYPGMHIMMIMHNVDIDSSL